MSYIDYNTPEKRYNQLNGKAYYVCHHCSGINVLDDEHANRKDTKWMLLTKRETKKLFKILSATLDMSYEETLVYLMHLHDKEKRGMYNEISPAGINKQ